MQNFSFYFVFTYFSHDKPQVCLFQSGKPFQTIQRGLSGSFRPHETIWPIRERFIENRLYRGIHSQIRLVLSPNGWQSDKETWLLKYCEGCFSDRFLRSSLSEEFISLFFLNSLQPRLNWRIIEEEYSLLDGRREHLKVVVFDYCKLMRMHR